MQIIDEKKIVVNGKLTTLIKKKRDNFSKNFNTKYSKKYIKNYLIKSKYFEDLQYKIFNTSLYSTLIGCILSFSLTLYSLFFIFQMPLILCLMSNKKVSHLIASLWLKKEVRSKIIENDLFLDSYVDQEILKAFVDEYGKAELYNLLKKEDNITYKEILEKANNLNEQKTKLNNESQINKEKVILEEAIDILSNMK